MLRELADGKVVCFLWSSSWLLYVAQTHDWMTVTSRECEFRLTAPESDLNQSSSRSFRSRLKRKKCSTFPQLCVIVLHDIVWYS